MKTFMRHIIVFAIIIVVVIILVNVVLLRDHVLSEYELKKPFVVTERQHLIASQSCTSFRATSDKGFIFYNYDANRTIQGDPDISHIKRDTLKINGYNKELTDFPAGEYTIKAQSKVTVYLSCQGSTVAVKFTHEAKTVLATGSVVIGILLWILGQRRLRKKN